MASQAVAARVGQLRLDQIVDVRSGVREGVLGAAGPAAQVRGGSGPTQFQPPAAAAAADIRCCSLHRVAIPIGVELMPKTDYLLETLHGCQMARPYGLTLVGDSGTSAPGYNCFHPTT
jgi:hypothetical protein